MSVAQATSVLMPTRHPTRQCDIMFPSGALANIGVSNFASTLQAGQSTTLTALASITSQASHMTSLFLGNCAASLLYTKLPLEQFHAVLEFMPSCAVFRFLCTCSSIFHWCPSLSYIGSKRLNFANCLSSEDLTFHLEHPSPPTWVPRIGVVTVERCGSALVTLLRRLPGWIPVVHITYEHLTCQDTMPFHRDLQRVSHSVQILVLMIEDMTLPTHSFYLLYPSSLITLTLWCGCWGLVSEAYAALLQELLVQIHNPNIWFYCLSGLSSCLLVFEHIIDFSIKASLFHPYVTLHGNVIPLRLDCRLAGNFSCAAEHLGNYLIKRLLTERVGPRPMEVCFTIQNDVESEFCVIWSTAS